VKADTYELRAILTQERRFVIPTFQRDYEWTQDGQWELLFDDLESVADKLGAKRREFEAAGKPATKADRLVAPHFLGAVVLDLLPTSAGSLDARSVIDGQQRLTTIQLLVRAVLDVLVDIDSPRAQQVRRLIQNPADVTQNVDDRHKLWPRRRDRDVWRAAMADEPPAASINHLYVEARAYFAERARKALETSGPDGPDLLVDSLLSLFKLVVIDLEDNDDGQVIFEVLNGRQTPLSATDLVKNLLFLRAELDSEAHLEELYDQHWAQFDDAWWRKEVGRGHAARGRRDVLMSAWLTAASGTEINVGHLYGEVRHYLDAGSHKTIDVLPALSASARAFREIDDVPGTVPERVADAYRRLNRLIVTTALPLLVWLRTLPAAKLTVVDHTRAVVAIDSWVMRRVLVGANTRGYGKRFVDVLKRAQAAVAAGTPVVEAIEQGLLDAGDNLMWITDGQVEDAFVGRSFYGVLSQERLRLILGAFDHQMHVEHPKGEHPTFDYNVLQIEHILPQAWRQNWSVEAADDTSRALLEQARDRSVNKIGNLTLVTAPLNPAMSNGAWGAKRAALTEHSNLRLNAQVVAPATADWNEEAIEKRARTLSALACRIWPRPNV
jgi:hypothetical protein